jgi:TonB dependent receptor-like, beta-barrel/TonB-dependent Receptor Plug Domain
MARRPGLKLSISLACASLALGATARAEDTTPTPAAPAAPAPRAHPAPDKAQVADAAPAEPDAPAVHAPAPAAPDADAPAEVGSEVVEIWGERPDKPFDRDTEVRLTGEELAARGATDLASALELIPDVNIRESGRGGTIVDIRGARKGAIKILVDGIAVSDPYYGTFDVSSIPVTDIVQIRVSLSPSSPIDGPGGPGGVIEVHTRDAIGARLAVGRAIASSLPEAMASATGRAQLGRHLGVRASATGTLGMRDFDLPDATVGQARHATTGAIRAEYRAGKRRIAIDGWLDHRSYVVPPSEDTPGDILVVDGVTQARAGAAYDDRLGRWQLESHAWGQVTSQASRYFSDPALTMPTAHEDLSAFMIGGAALVTHPVGKSARVVGSATVDRETGTDTTDHGSATGTTTVSELAAGGQYEHGGLRIDLAAGAAVPLGGTASPWPEGKLEVTARPVDAVTLTATAARKGRLPTLRERFRPDIGNQGLGPEIADYGEVKVALRPASMVEVETAGWVRDASGMILFDPMALELVNLGETRIHGLDARARVSPDRRVTVGSDYSYTVATSATDSHPLDYLPAHRLDGWVTASPWSPLSVTARLQYVGSRTQLTNTLAPYTTVDLTASARLGGDWLAVARCDDLTDVRWELRQGIHAPGRVVSLAVQGTWR